MTRPVARRSTADGAHAPGSSASRMGWVVGRSEPPAGSIVRPTCASSVRGRASTGVDRPSARRSRQPRRARAVRAHQPHLVDAGRRELGQTGRGDEQAALVAGDHEDGGAARRHRLPHRPRVGRGQHLGDGRVTRPQLPQVPAGVEGQDAQHGRRRHRHRREPGHRLSPPPTALAGRPHQVGGGQDAGAEGRGRGGGSGESEPGGALPQPAHLGRAYAGRPTGAPRRGRCRPTAGRARRRPRRGRGARPGMGPGGVRGGARRPWRSQVRWP